MNGYYTIDLQEIDYSDGVNITVPGVYNSITRAKKPVILYNFSIQTVPYCPSFCTVSSSGGSYVIDFDYTASVYFEITSDDKITCRNFGRTVSVPRGTADGDMLVWDNTNNEWDAVALDNADTEEY